MKTTVIYNPATGTTQKLHQPNAATQRELHQKFLDSLLVGAIGAGAAASLLFMLILF